jgi:hypothetical protein
MEYRDLEVGEVKQVGDQRKNDFTDYDELTWADGVSVVLPEQKGQYRRPMAISSDTAPVVDKLLGKKEPVMPVDLKWLAENVEDWPLLNSAKVTLIRRFKGLAKGYARSMDALPGYPCDYSKVQWQEARQQLGLDKIIAQANMVETSEECSVCDGTGSENVGSDLRPFNQQCRNCDSSGIDPDQQESIDTPESQEWEESGLPSIGTICEARPTSEADHCIAKALLHDGGYVAFVGMQHGSIYNNQKLFWSTDYRPLPTPEQKEAEERVKFADSLSDTIVNDAGSHLTDFRDVRDFGLVLFDWLKATNQLAKVGK